LALTREADGSASGGLVQDGERAFALAVAGSL
jgi:hypothetical protein